jgi:glutamate-1-semialdehyde 2,1-aminomutase
MASLEFRPGKPKMRHPGTFNANPLSAAAGIATLELVATSEPTRRANEVGRQMRQKLNALFAQRGWDWIAYGEFSGWRLLPNYRGARPDADDFVPYGGDVEKLDGPRDPKLTQAFRRAMLLGGVDVWGLSGNAMAAHTDEDVEKTVAAIASAVEVLRAEGLVS